MVGKMGFLKEKRVADKTVLEKVYEWVELTVELLAVRKVLIEVETMVVMMVGKMGDLKEKRMADTTVVEKVYESVELRVALLAVR